MRVMLLSPTQHTHATIAKIVNEEVKLFQGRKLTSILSGVTFAVAARIAAVANALLWTICEVTCFIPRLVIVGINLALSSSSSFVTTLWRIAKVYSLVMRISVIQGFSFGCAAILPEVLYPKLEVHKTLFSLHVQALLETLPDLPTIDQSIYKNIQEGFLDPLARLWHALGLSSNKMRDLLQNALLKSFEKDFKLAGELIDVESVTFRRLFCTTLCAEMVKKLNTSVTKEVSKHICPFTFSMMYSDLTLEARREIIKLRPELVSELENGEPYTHAMTYRYLHPQDKQLSQHLLEKMIGAGKMLVERDIFKQDDLSHPSAYRPIVLIGLYRFLETARVPQDNPSHIVFTLNESEDIAITEDTRFFGTREELIEIHKMIVQLSSAQKEALFQRFSMTDEEDNDPLVKGCFERIGQLETYVINQRVISLGNVSDKDSTDWNKAFS